MSQTALSLLLTKLNRPPVPPDRVDRPRLVAALNSGLSGPLTIVSAGAGFGKTTLVSSWIESLAAASRAASCEAIPSAWLSLDPADSDLGVFLHYFAAAIRQAYSDACGETLALLRAPVPAAPATLLVALANDIHALPGRLIVVLDDYHAIRGVDVHDLLSGLLRHWPERLHLVLISRTSPPLPLAALRAKGRLTEIRTHNLRFTPEETSAFLRKTVPAPLSQDTLDLLDRRLEGWIAGLRLLTLSAFATRETEGELAALSGSNVEIAEYLVYEVLSSQSPAMQRFLLATSVCDRFCAELCEHILASAHGLSVRDSIGGAESADGSPDDVRGYIRWLDSHNLFVVSLDNEGKWHRYHQLFQELLQRHLAAEFGAQQLADLHRAAATWFGDRGMVDEAVGHALQAADFDQAASFMVTGLQEVLNREDRATLDRWLSRLPEDFIQQRPWLLLIRAFAFQFSWRLTTVGKLIGQIEVLLNEGSEAASRQGNSADFQTLRGLLALMRGQQLFHGCQASEAITRFEEVLKLLPEGWLYPRGAARFYWALCMRAMGKVDAARMSLTEEFESLVDRTDAYAPRLAFGMAFNHLETGHLEEARQTAQMMLDLASPGHLMILQGFGRFFLGTAHYCWNDLATAEKHFREGVEIRRATHAQAARSCMLGMALVLMAKGETGEAREMLELLSQLDMERTGVVGDDARSLQAQLEYSQGNAEAAFRWADAYSSPVPDRLINFIQDPHLAKASLLIARGAEGDLEASLGILDALNEITERSYCTRLQTDILAARAVVLEQQGRSVAALASLEQAVENARMSGSVRSFVGLGATMRTLLLRLAGRGYAVETVRRILDAFPQLDASAAAAAGTRARTANAGLLEPLTDRELDVLVLLRERLSNKEIAQRLGLSVMTVKRHTVNLYGKLDVDGRKDAVVKAEALKVLPPS